MTILRQSPISYNNTEVELKDSANNKLAVVPSDTGFDVKNIQSGEIVSSGSSVFGALETAKDLGIDRSQVNAEAAFELEEAPFTQEQIDTETDEAFFADIERTTNFSATETETIERYQNASFVSLVPNDEFENDTGINRSGFSSKRTIQVNPGAEKSVLPPPRTIVVDRKGNKLERDLRVRIKVPPKYLTGYAEMLKINEGIIFPFTPSISFEVKADYANSAPMHSNFQINFYQRSSVGPISITGKFSVQSEKDARMYVAMMYLLKAITRMRSGGAKSGDPDSGAPPPVCRLFGYGNGMFDNVPVAVTSYRVELPDAVDYFTVNTGGISGDVGSGEVTSVPTLSTIAITCLPMYSREEMQKFSVNSYLNGGLKGKGYI